MTKESLITRKENNTDPKISFDRVNNNSSNLNDTISKQCNN